MSEYYIVKENISKGPSNLAIGSFKDSNS